MTFTTGTDPPKLSLAVTADSVVTNTIYFSVGSSQNPYFSALQTIDIVVCGMGTFKTKSAEPEEYSLRKGSGTTKILSTDDFKEWFELDGGAKGTHPACSELTDNSYQLQIPGGLSGYKAVSDDPIINY